MKNIFGKKLLLIIAFFFVSNLLSLNCHALEIKLALLSPEGSNWANQIQKFSQEVKTATKGAVSFKTYFGGVAGDETDVIRKIHIGQFQGGIFTTRTLGDIYRDVRVIEIPFTFKGDRQTAWKTLEKMAPNFNQGLGHAGFKNLGFFELGNIYFVSTKKVTSIEDLKKLKIWIWGGDQLISGLMKSLQLVSVPLALPDVLTSMSMGVIDAAYASPEAIIALQWHNKIKYLIDFPLAFSLGAFLLSHESWAKIPVKEQKIIEDLSQKMVKSANLKTIENNQAALSALKKNGVEFISLTAADVARTEAIYLDIIKNLKGEVISSHMMDLFSAQIKL